MISKTSAEAIEIKVQAAISSIRFDMNVYGMSKDEAIKKYLENSMFGPKLIDRLYAEA